MPIIENKPLARALYAEVEIGDMIPDEYYQALAVILAKVYALDSMKIKNNQGNVTPEWRRSKDYSKTKLTSS